MNTSLANKDEFIELLRSTGRDGVDDLIAYLDEGRNHFFSAPASVNHHLNHDVSTCAMRHSNCVSLSSPCAPIWLIVCSATASS